MRESSHQAAQFASIHVASPSLSIDPIGRATWRDLYLQALFETDKHKVCNRIAAAERALLFREHELFNGPQNITEREAVNTALHALHALRSCLEHRKHDLAA
jgi:hypothetical protein